MNNRTINIQRCIGCGKCVIDCINQYLILIKDKNGQLHASFKERGRCLECGHCNAICPVGAISGGKAIGHLDDNDFILSLMAKKRTVRKYKKDAVINSDALDKIILAGQTAPTDRNRRSARIILVKDKLPYVYNTALDYLVEEVKKTGTINPLYVPTMLLDSKRNEILWNAEYLVIYVGQSYQLIDAAISAERMQLEACNLGFGTAYRGDMRIAINHLDELRDLFEMKKNEEVLITFAMGVPDLTYLRPAVKQNHKIEYK